MATKKAKKEDKSEHIEQDKKVSFDFGIRELPWTGKQQKIIETAQTKEARVVFIKSPPGCGKTLISVYVALNKLKQKQVGKITYVRVPCESSSYGIGFLPSDLESKMEPWLEPAMDHLKALIVNGGLGRLLDESYIEAIPLGFVKGRTYNSSVVIIDEAEDLTAKDFRLIMSRLGKRSLMFVIGDEDQSNVKNSGFQEVYNLFNNEESKNNGIHCFEFGPEDSLRSDITKFILEKFDDLKRNSVKK